MQELEITEMGAGHDIACYDVFTPRASGNALGPGLLLGVLEHAIPAHGLC